jgi:hypothetical protein
MRPGMSDGRQFGDDVWKPNCDLNGALQGSMNNEQFRSYIVHNSSQVEKKLQLKINDPKV